MALRLSDLFNLFHDLHPPLVDVDIGENEEFPIADNTQYEDEPDVSLDALTHRGNDISNEISYRHNETDEDPKSTHSLGVVTSNALDSQTRTLLSNAAMIDDPEAIKALLSYGADTSIADVAGWTPLHIAAREGSLKATKSLLGFDMVNDRDPKIKPLGKPESSFPLRESSANVDPRDNIGRTPLSIAIRSQQTDVALFLLQQGAGINLRDYYGRSPIFHAIMYNNETIIKALLRRDCNATFIGEDGGTILHTAAVHATRSTISLLRVMLPLLPAMHLPSTRVLDEQGRTALTCARQTIETSDDPLYKSADFEDLLSAIKPRMKIEAGIYSKLSKQNRNAILALLTLLFYIFTTFSPIPAVRGDMRNVRSVVSAWIIPIFSLGTLLEYIGSSFFWKRITGFVRRICAEPIPPNKVRVQWYCVGPESCCMCASLICVDLWTISSG